jgi:hypothetical protein
MTSISKCEDTFCKKYVDIAHKNMKKGWEEHYGKDLPKEIEKIDKQLAKSDLEDKKRAELKEMKKYNEQFIKKWKNKTWKKKTHKRLDKETAKECNRVYCNPKCKNTLFESGKELSEGFRKKIIKTQKKSSKKDREKMLTYFEEKHRKIHGNKENVLLDGFYEGLSQKKIKKIRKNGAISGCILDTIVDTIPDTM